MAGQVVGAFFAPIFNGAAGRDIKLVTQGQRVIEKQRCTALIAAGAARARVIQ
ncbi:Uncharacterised protein [Yersinia enterocolitica]|nr:Uncharacterised protein [Yersinia enterocolitica]